jgi:hypothetical protein
LAFGECNADSSAPSVEHSATTSAAVNHMSLWTLFEKWKIQKGKREAVDWGFCSANNSRSVAGV